MTTDQIVEELCQKQSNLPNKGALVILMGLPYSGKSTVSELLREEGFFVLWATVIKKEYRILDAEMLDVSLKTSEKLLREGKGVVFDFLNHTNEVRSPFIELAKRLNKEYKIVYLNTPKEEITRRQEKVMQDGASLGRSLISKEVIEIISSELEEPDKNDHLIEVINSDSTELRHWLDTLAR